jgi:hypothetical protein
VGIQEVRLDRGGTEPTGEYTIFYGKGIENYVLVGVFSYIRDSYQQLRGQEVAGDSLSHILLRGRWCNVVFLNAHVQKMMEFI